MKRLASGQRATVLLCVAPGAVVGDPDPAATRDRDVTLLGIGLPGKGGVSTLSVVNPAWVAGAADAIAVAIESLGETAVAIAGSSSGGLVALALAARRPELVTRLVIIGTRAPGAATSADLGFQPSAIRAKTLLVYGGTDPDAASAHGRWWQRNLPDARLEMTPDAGDRLLPMRWDRVLAHLAPRSAG